MDIQVTLCFRFDVSTLVVFRTCGFAGLFMVFIVFVVLLALRWFDCACVWLF